MKRRRGQEESSRVLRSGTDARSERRVNREERQKQIKPKRVKTKNAVESNPSEVATLLRKRLAVEEVVAMTLLYARDWRPFCGVRMSVDHVFENSRLCYTPSGVLFGVSIIGARCYAINDDDKVLTVMADKVMLHSVDDVNDNDTMGCVFESSPGDTVVAVRWVSNSRFEVWCVNNLVITCHEGVKQDDVNFVCSEDARACYMFLRLPDTMSLHFVVAEQAEEYQGDCHKTAFAIFRDGEHAIFLHNGESFDNVYSQTKRIVSMILLSRRMQLYLCDVDLAIFQLDLIRKKRTRLHASPYTRDVQPCATDTARWGFLNARLDKLCLAMQLGTSVYQFI